jgi:hypothetical protein
MKSVYHKSNGSPLFVIPCENRACPALDAGNPLGFNPSTMNIVQNEPSKIADDAL